MHRCTGTTFLNLEAAVVYWRTLSHTVFVDGAWVSTGVLSREPDRIFPGTRMRTERGGRGKKEKSGFWDTNRNLSGPIRLLQHSRD